MKTVFDESQEGLSRVSEGLKKSCVKDGATGAVADGMMKRVDDLNFR